MNTLSCNFSCFVLVVSLLVTCSFISASSLPLFRPSSSSGQSHSSSSPSPSSPSAAQISNTSSNSTVCVIYSDTVVNCNGTFYNSSSTNDDCGETMAVPFSMGWWIDIIVIIICVLSGGLMSGLTIGLLSLDTVRLEIMESSGTESEKKYAPKVKELLVNHHWLLVTLLLCNASAMEALPLFLDNITTPWIAIIISVTMVLAMGEILPQAICSRWGLAIGARLYWLVVFLMYVTSPISYPIAMLLDCALGTHDSEFFNRSGLKEMIRLHAGAKESGEALTQNEVALIHGAMDIQNKTARDCMTPLEDVFMVDEETITDQSFLKMVVSKGFTRIPVYRSSRTNIVSMLLIRDLVGVQASSTRPVKALKLHPSLYIKASEAAYDVMDIMQTGASHLAILYEVQVGTLKFSEEERKHFTGQRPVLQIITTPFSHVPQRSRETSQFEPRSGATEPKSNRSGDESAGDAIVRKPSSAYAIAHSPLRQSPPSASPVLATYKGRRRVPSLPTTALPEVAAQFTGRKKRINPVEDPIFPRASPQAQQGTSLMSVDSNCLSQPLLDPAVSPSSPPRDLHMRQPSAEYQEITEVFSGTESGAVAIGVVSFEDLLEELLQEEIYDEKDLAGAMTSGKTSVITRATVESPVNNGAGGAGGTGAISSAFSAAQQSRLQGNALQVPQPQPPRVNPADAIRVRRTHLRSVISKLRLSVAYQPGAYHGPGSPDS